MKTMERPFDLTDLQIQLHTDLWQMLSPKFCHGVVYNLRGLSRKPGLRSGEGVGLSKNS